MSDEYDVLLSVKKECYQYAKEHFRGKSYLNKNRQVYIQVSKTGLDEWYSKSKSREQILSIRKLDNILESAIYTHSAENKHKNDRSGAKFDYFECIVELDSVQYVAVLSIKNIQEKNEQRLIYYHHYLAGIKIKPSSTLSRQSETSSVVLLDGFQTADAI